MTETKKKKRRPLKFQESKELETQIEDYFSQCKENDEPLTMTGLALAIGFTSRKQLYEYEERDEFRNALKKARLRVEGGYEKRLHGNSPTGAIFALKNMGWIDKQDIDMTTKADPNEGINRIIEHIEGKGIKELERVAYPDTTRKSDSEQSGQDRSGS